jgi:branched-chain amino acid transport system substrate-binding protein
MTPTLYVYPDDPRSDVRDLMARYHVKYGIDMNYIGQTGVSVAQIALEALQRAGKDLTVESLGPVIN